MANEEFINMLYEESFEMSSSDSEEYWNTSSSDDELCEQRLQARKLHLKVDNFWEVVALYDDGDFKKHFRLERTTVNLLIDMYDSAGIVPSHSHGGCSKMGARKQVFIFLWYVGNTLTFRQLGDFFGVSQSSAWQAVLRVASWLQDISENYIKWPRGQEANNVMAAFERIKGIPCILGAIDGTHIKIKAPKENPQIYFNRKKYYSLAIQVVVNADKKIIDIHCGEPGSLHDSRILRRSPLYEDCVQNESSLFPNNSFIIGDSAYPQKNWLVPPFTDNGHLTSQQIRFNVIHSSTRMVVENAFGILKSRFRRLLHFTELSNLHFVVKIIIACCVLHNICIDGGDIFTNEQIYNSENEITSGPDESNQQQNGPQKRQQIFNLLVEKGLI